MLVVEDDERGDVAMAGLHVTMMCHHVPSRSAGTGTRHVCLKFKFRRNWSNCGCRILTGRAGGARDRRECSVQQAVPARRTMGAASGGRYLDGDERS
jgi:hypothetical protein